MFWRRRPAEEPGEPPAAAELPGDGTVTDAEIEAQLEAELAAADAALAEAAAEGTTTMPEPIGGPGGPPAPEAVGPADLEAGVARSRSGFVARLRGLFGLGEPDAATWEEVEETLIAADVGAILAIEVVARARAQRDALGPEAAVRAELAALLVPREAPWDLRPAEMEGPAVVLVVGVNGTGKTTTIGKLAARERAAGRRVLLAAADTFRAAAIDQLRLWGERAGVPVIAHAPGADPGAVVFDALDAAVARGLDLVIADTAGRLHTKVSLMDELAKVRRVIARRLPGAVPEVLFVLDATTGQNGLAQARAFHEAIGLTGIVLAKLDSTAKGGIVFAIEADLRVPVRYVGVGEQIGDLLPFDPDVFVAALFA
ncbi:MAG: signal recognition particle-docking protein FtsY [Chloroflexi bacterium]|jgi:fused signal recognition particle receptor|nr:signal recognition particle-docking protein FtsY [Chloroflexota bacterium]